jgi:hypothetical protein
MNKKDEALKMATKALTNVTNAFMPDNSWIGTDIFQQTEKAYQACKEALEQPSQEPYAFRHKTTGEFCSGGFEAKHLDQWIPLYTNPIESCQGLSFEEIDAIGDKIYNNNKWSDVEGMDFDKFARAIEQAFKEKNL